MKLPRKQLKKRGKFLLLIRNFVQSIGKITLTALKFILTPLFSLILIFFKSLDLIGRVTLKFLALIGKLSLFYFSRIKKAFLRFCLLIQFIGEVTLLGIFIAAVFIRALFVKAGLLRPTKRTKLARISTITKKHLKKANFFENLKKGVLGLRYLTLSPPSRYVTVSALSVLLLWGAYYQFFFKNLPSPYDLEKKTLPASTQIFDRNGKLLFIYYNGKTNRIPISFSQMPQSVREATIAVEDKEFYSHRGVSVKGIARALVNNVLKKPKQGGSTITQQLIKIALLYDDRRILSRKIKEAYLALMVERVYPKNKILEMYLNNAPYGGTAYGIEAAARKYFGKETSQLTLAEASLLATLPSAPSIYSPYSTDFGVYKSNQKSVLENMVEKKFISLDTAQNAYREKLNFYSIENQISAPHFVFWVIDQLENDLGKTKVQEGGLLVTTTLDLPTQLKAEQIVKENVEKVEKNYWISNAAALVTEPRTGKILAMVGSRDYFDEKHDGNVNVTVARRQPGSSIKVVNYAYALAYGGFTPSSVIDDSPVSYRNAWETYSPVNYDGKYRGRVTLKQALAMSLNVPAVKVLNTYGPDKMVDLGIKMGIESWKDLKNYGLSLTLGAGEVRMTELATVYGTFSNLGKRVDLYPIEKIVDPKNNTVLVDVSQNKKSVLGVATAQAADDDSVIPEYTAYQLTNILADNSARMPAFGPYAKLEVPGHKVAVKTGTTNNIRDNWTIGYTPDFLVASWVGNNDNSPMNPHLTSGITGAAPIWNEIMSSLLEGKPSEEYAIPSGMIKVKVCAVNGLLTCPRCPKEVEEYFAPGQEPKTQCYFPSVEECKAKKDQLTSEGKSPDEVNKALVNCPAGSTN